MSTPKILVVEDDAPISKLLCQFLGGDGFTPKAVNCGEDAIVIAKDWQPDLILLDLMLPGMDGIETCQALREIYSGPILMLTAHAGEMQEVIALNAGVDDFLQKPIRPLVLKARIQALFRRRFPASDALSVAGLSIDRERRHVLFNDTTIELSDSEFELLWALASRAGEIVSRESLFRIIRGREYDGLDRSIDMRISKLRKKLFTHLNRDVIRTLRSAGYLFVNK